MYIHKNINLTNINNEPDILEFCSKKIYFAIDIHHNITNIMLHIHLIIFNYET